jgi:F-type H+-transporting ATPase subunit epsilon
VAHEKFRVEVLTPEGEVFDDEVERISTRTHVGSIGILARHQPLLGLLEPTELRLYRSEGDVVRYAQGEGYVQVSPERVLLLVEEAHEPGELDVSDLRDKLKKAEDELSSAGDDSEAARRAARARRRWQAFIEVAEGGSAGAP